MSVLTSGRTGMKADVHWTLKLGPHSLHFLPPSWNSVRSWSQSCEREIFMSKPPFTKGVSAPGRRHVQKLWWVNKIKHLFKLLKEVPATEADARRGDVQVGNRGHKLSINQRGNKGAHWPVVHPRFSDDPSKCSVEIPIMPSMTRLSTFRWWKVVDHQIPSPSGSWVSPHSSPVTPEGWGPSLSSDQCTPTGPPHAATLCFLRD